MSKELEKRLRKVQEEYGGSIEQLLEAARIGAEMERELNLRAMHAYMSDPNRATDPDEMMEHLSFIFRLDGVSL